MIWWLGAETKLKGWIYFLSIRQCQQNCHWNANALFIALRAPFNFSTTAKWEWELRSHFKVEAHLIFSTFTFHRQKLTPLLLCSISYKMYNTIFWLSIVLLSNNYKLTTPFICRNALEGNWRKTVSSPNKGRHAWFHHFKNLWHVE